MEFIIGGHSYEIDRDDILAATRDVAPKPFDGRNRYYVELHGSRYPIKQVIHLVTGLPYTEGFTAQYVSHILKRLGFEVQTLLRRPRLERRSATSAATADGASRFAIVLEEDEDGFIVASCPALPGCHSQGKSEAEAVSNVKEAIRGYVASMRRHGEHVPTIKEVRQIEVLV